MTDIVELIDNAIADTMSTDAMRWTPEPTEPSAGRSPTRWNPSGGPVVVTAINWDCEEVLSWDCENILYHSFQVNFDLTVFDVDSRQTMLDILLGRVSSGDEHLGDPVPYRGYRRSS